MAYDPVDAEAARQMETVRQHLIRIDPDAARILTTDIEDAQKSWKTNAVFTKELQAYAVAKNAAGQMHLYDRLFIDTAEH
jgi:hypothetical protein